jgi:hypothetical protein
VRRHPSTYDGCLFAAIAVYALGWLFELLYLAASSGDKWGDQALPVLFRGSLAVLVLLSAVVRGQHRKAVAYYLLVGAVASLAGSIGAIWAIGLPIWVASAGAVLSIGSGYLAAWAVRLSSSERPESYQERAARLAATYEVQEQKMHDAYAEMGHQARMRLQAREQEAHTPDANQASTERP